MRTEVVGMAPRAGPVSDVIEAVPSAQATYRVLDERVVVRQADAAARQARDDAFEQAVFSAAAKTGALFVSFVVMILRWALGVAMVGALALTALTLFLGLLSGVYRFELMGLFFGAGFGAFVAIVLVTQFEVWVCRAAGIERR